MVAGRKLAVTRRGGLVVAVGAVAVAALGSWWWTRPVTFPPPDRRVALGPEPDQYVGARVCGECHAAQFAAWQGSTHARAGGIPDSTRVLAPFDGRPIRFADAVVIPERTRDGQFRFVVRSEAQPPETLRVAGVIGGGHLAGGGTQGFVTGMPDGTVRFLPFDFIRREATWFCNTNSRTNRGWVPVTTQVALAECADWPPVRVLGAVPQYATCQECHGSQIRVTRDSAAGTYRTEIGSFRINCESCHGPGRTHADRARGGRLGAEGLGLPILDTLGKAASVRVCFACHALKDQLAPGYLSGGPLEAFYSTGLPLLGQPSLFPDGRVNSFAYQENHLYSDCYLNGSLTCVDCHDPHSQGYRDVWGTPLEDRFDDRQCTACHPSKVVRPEQHTSHPVRSTGGRCVACHMPYLQHPELGRQLRYARADHSIPVPRPGFDDSLGIENACRQCHAAWTLPELERIVSERWGDLKPHKPIVAAAFRVGSYLDAADATRALLDTSLVHPAAQLRALGELAVRFFRPGGALGPDAERILRRWTAVGDLDLRATALAVLHLVQGTERRTRRYLVRALARAGAQGFALRARWAAALGTFGDAYFARTEWEAASAAYARALEVLPDHAGVRMNLGLARLYAGDRDSALAVLAALVEDEPRSALAWLNLGLVYESLGRLDEAEQMYRRSASANPDEGLAHFNLGNVLLRRGKAAEAIEAYRAAVRLRPDIPRTHFYLARAYLELGEREQALRAARRGLRFAPNDPNARELVRELEGTRRRVP